MSPPSDIVAPADAGLLGLPGPLLHGLLLGATLAGFLIAENLFGLAYSFSPALWLAGPLLGMVFVGLSGMTATWRVITHAPVSVLRMA